MGKHIPITPKGWEDLSPTSAQKSDRPGWWLITDGHSHWIDLHEEEIENLYKLIIKERKLTAEYEEDR